MTLKRRILTGWLIALGLGTPSIASAQNDWRVLTNGAVVLFRHALAPGTADPPGFRLNDCRTQRNLNAEGRAQARRIGEAFRARRVTVTRVLTSQWCRARETAMLAFPGVARDEAAFNSFFGDSEREAGQTSAARGVLSRWNGPGVLVVMTHQVNITALTGIVPASGEGVIVRFEDGRLKVLGRVTP
ncbi:histidine phosphatase family protein [Deinococcus peraridilitoris]|uniref:Phosphohistidine phosphatase SixA n=1 Tax=Deinococcus peraridilitoris (strain DSM 19664 / LMG 22246 / CIP 109416 / KR-200) TaxID=937777 RepID=L0A059_DEIPD|nr:histidine phosphatase family protein [Deinococcus peraridilitoris]AFZ67221.1 phosphohistidine phosphatase SixA [Deinococcus peraridilitoris DSM 19664]